MFHDVLRGVVTLAPWRCYTGEECEDTLSMRRFPSFLEPGGGGAADISGSICRRNLVARSLVWDCMEPMCSGVASCWGRLAISVIGARRQTRTHTRAFSIQQLDASLITNIIAISQVTSLQSSCRHVMRSHACMLLYKLRSRAHTPEAVTLRPSRAALWSFRSSQRLFGLAYLPCLLRHTCR